MNGTVRWLDDDPVTGNAWLRITCKGVVREYEFERSPQGYRLHRLDLRTFALVTYTVDPRGGHGRWVCDCPAAKHRGGECKHARGIRAALNRAPF